MKRAPKGSSIEPKRQPERNQYKASVNSKQSNRRIELPSVNKPSQQKIPEKSQEPYKQEQNYIDQALGNLFHQYFIKNGFMKTLQCFQKQQSQGSNNRQQPEEFKRLLLENFDKGDKYQFFRIFNKYTPLHIRMKDQRTTKLQFYLNIYFLIFKVHPFNNQTKKKNAIDSQDKQSFQKYLENKGQALSKTSQFLNYYALPYINPIQNPQFKHLFSQDWIDQLRQKVINFVDCLYPSQTPLLCQIYEQHVQKSIKDHQQSSSLGAGLVARKNEEIQQLHKKNQEMQIYLQTLAGKYWQFQNNFKKFGENTKNTLAQSQKKWFQLTQQIFYMAATSFEIADSRQSEYPEQTNRQLKRIKQKILKYQGFINTNIDDLINQDVDLSMFQKPSVSMENEISHEPEIHANTFISLNIKKIKQTFLTQNIDEIVALMKALKHRIKVAQGVYLKRQIVVQLCFFDIFVARQQGQPLLRKLLFNDRIVCEQLVKLVSALANDYYGRTYLFNAMDLLMQQMMKQTGDTVVRRCLIVTFEFMSIRRKGQLSMIHNGFIKWIINILKNERETLSEQNLEYLTALLMNLSFIKQGLDECEQIRDELMMNLIELLQHKNKDIQSYINGTLYRVLSRRSFRQKAHEHGLSDIIDYQINNGASVDTTQLNHVKAMLSLQEEQNFPDETEMEDLEDGDIDDIDNQPLIMNHLMNEQQQNEETNEERILVQSYTIAGPEIIEHIKAISRQVDDSLKRKQASFIRNEMNSQDRPRSVMRPLLRNRSNLSSNLANSASNRMLPSQLRQRVRPYVQGQQQQVPVSPMSRQSSLHNSQIPKPIRQYQNHPQYSQLFQPRNQIVRTPPHSNM